MKKIEAIILGIIIAVAIFFRFYNLSSVPPQATVDEASIGYNAFSILKTGADEYGTKFPILLRAYDDYRPALYVYLVIPFVKIFGLNVLSVRLPSAVLSVLSVLAVYFIVKEFTRDAKIIKWGKVKIDIPLVTTALFAISPWHIYISRLGHEVNASCAFLIFGILFFLRFVNSQGKHEKWNLILSAIFFGLSFDSYQSTKIVIPLLVLIASLLYLKILLKEKFAVFISALIGFIIILPILFSSFSQDALIRFRGTNLLTNSSQYFEKIDQRMIEERRSNDFLGRIFDNRKSGSLNLISHAYLAHLDPVWLFINEGNEQFKAPTIGLLYLFEFPLILMGLISMSRMGIKNKNIVFIAAWAASAIIPGAITTGYAHPMRVFSILPIPHLLTAVGFISIASFFERFKKYITLAFVLLVAIFSIWFFHSYFVLVPRELSPHFQYGVFNAFSYSEKIDKNYEKVIVSNTDRLFESYMFYLYFNKYDPLTYQKAGGTKTGGFNEEHSIGKYKFEKIGDKISKNTLYIINPDEKKLYMNLVRKIKYTDGTTSLVIAEIK